MPTLGVNIDHVATVRQARRTQEPDPVAAALAAEQGGADQITIHLREDRRHIQDFDVPRIADAIQVRLNLECACIAEMIELALKLKPDQVCLVPEKRQEITTEGGLDLVSHRTRLAAATEQLSKAGILVSLFIDPNPEHVRIASEIGAGAVELHTGAYANAADELARTSQLQSLHAASEAVLEQGLLLHAGHGLNYENVQPIARIAGMQELNIGHSIVARSIFVGLRTAVREMKQLLDEADPLS